MTFEKIDDKPKSPKSLEELKLGTEIPKRKRRIKSEIDSVPLLPPANIPIEAVKPIVSIPFSVVARVTKFKNWELTETENDDLANAVKICIDTYMPYALDRWMPLISLIIVTGSITLTKAQEYGKYKIELEKISNEKYKQPVFPDDGK